MTSSPSAAVPAAAAAPAPAPLSEEEEEEQPPSKSSCNLAFRVLYASCATLEEGTRTKPTDKAVACEEVSWREGAREATLKCSAWSIPVVEVGELRLRA
jgi:hypothetical protein